MSLDSEDTPGCCCACASGGGNAGGTSGASHGVRYSNVAFLFAGQGAQHPGMGTDIAQANPAAAAIFEQADALRPGTSTECFEGTAEELAQTSVTQPCVFTVDLACAAALEARGVCPAAVAGFSLGEVAALAYAGAFSFDAGLSLVMKRAAFMDAACQENPGGMSAALKLDAQTVEELAARAGDCWPVNYNSPQQTVVAGTAQGLETFTGLVREARGRCSKLAVSGPFHSPLMQPAAKQLRAELKTCQPSPTSLDVWANATAAPYPGAPDDMADLLARQVASPVRWTDTLQGLWDAGITIFIELGAGKVLSKLVGRCLPEATALGVETAEELDAALELLAVQGQPATAAAGSPVHKS